jgi:hypothetical protein
MSGPSLFQPMFQPITVVSAYHGARAEKHGFNLTAERSFDQGAGKIDVFLHEITRALLNLISNGFYTATKSAKSGTIAAAMSLLLQRRRKASAIA